MTWLRWVPRFIYGPDNLDFTLTYPVTRWHPGGRSVGRSGKTATNVTGNVITLQKSTLSMNLRFTEDEWWDTVRDFLLWTQHGFPFLWFPNDLVTVEGPVSYEVIVDFPRVADVIAPTRDGSLLWMMQVPITLLRTDGEIWDRDYMTLPAILPEDSVSAVPTHYLVTPADDTVVPGGSTLVTAQLAAADDTPIHQAGHFLVFEVTGDGGTIDTLSGVTDSLGKVTTLLHVGAYQTIHTVSVTDEDDRSGFSPDIEVITGGTAYTVTSDSYEELTTLSVVISAQLKNAGVDVAEAGHVVTWSKTGTGGAFSAPTSVTDGTGKATVTLTFGTADTNYVVTATDEFATTGFSPAIHSYDEGIGFLRAISNLEFAVDVAACSILTGGGALAALVDHSGKDVTITLGQGGGGHDPVYQAAGWAITGGTMPRLVFDHDAQNWFLIDLPTFAQPHTVVLVFDGFAVTGAGQHNAVNLGGAVHYRNAAWSIFAGSIANSAFLSSDVANQGKLIRIDVANGVASRIYRGSTASAALNTGGGGSVAGFTAIGARYDGVDAATMKLAAVAIYSKALDATERGDVIAGFAARYPGLGTS
jgi:hypothetical protein